LHNSEKDEMFKPTVDTWINRIELPIDQPHFLTYKTTSVNGLEVSSRRYKVMNQDSIDITIPLNVISELNYDDGSIKLYLKLEKENDIIPEINHYVMITRSSSVDGFKEWDEIYKSFYTNDKFNQSNKILIWEDYNI
jgi:hypothetical protein